MTTAADIVNSALLKVGAIASGETAPADMSVDALATLNDMLDGFANENLMLFQITQDSFPLVAGQATYTIGTSGNVNTTRPMHVTSAFIRNATYDYPLGIVTKEQFDRIVAKSVTSEIPTTIYVDTAFPLSTIKVWPTPSSAASSIYLSSYKPLTSFATLQTTVTLPPGYLRMLKYNLACDLMPEYPMQGGHDQMVMEIAKNSKAWIKRTNFKPGVLKLDSNIPQRRSFNNILIGE